MPETFTSPIAQVSLTDNQNLETRVRNMEQTLARLLSGDLQFPSMDSISSDLGQFQVGEFIAGTGTPEGGDLTGAAMLSPGVVINGIEYNLIGMNNGALEFGLSAIDGTAIFAGGQAILNSSGLILSGLNYPIQFNATNLGLTRTARFGMTLLTGGTIPSIQWDFEGPAGTNVVLNGNFGTGTLASWTDAGAAWSVLSDDGGLTFYAEHGFGVAAWPAELTQVITSILPLTLYTIQFDSRRLVGYLTPKLYLDWRDSLHNVLRTDVINGNPGSGFSTTSKTLLTPAATAEVNIRMNAGGDPFQQTDFTNVFLGLTGIVQQLSLTDVGLQISELTLQPAAPAAGNMSLYAIGMELWSQDETGVATNLTHPFSDRRRMVPVSSDFLHEGALGYFGASIFNSGNLVDLASEAGHPGIFRFSSTATAGSSGARVVGASQAHGPILGGGEVYEVIFRIQLNVALGRHGWVDTIANVAPSNGAWLDLNSLIITGKTAKAAATATTGTSYTASTGVWYRGVVVFNTAGTRFDFYIYDMSGNLLWTDNLTIDIPIVPVAACSNAWRGSATASPLMDVDYVNIYSIGPLVR